MLIIIAGNFSTTPLLVVADSWFCNASLWRPVRKVVGERFHMPSRLRSNNALYTQPDKPLPGQRGRHCKYGKRLETST